MATRDIQAGSAGIIIEVLLRSTTGSFATSIPASSVTYAYTREGDNARSYATCSTGVLDTWGSGTWKEIDATNYKGKYQFGVPNAAIASGARKCTLIFTGTGFIDKSEEINLFTNNPQNVVLTYPINFTT